MFHVHCSLLILFKVQQIKIIHQLFRSNFEKQERFPFKGFKINVNLLVCRGLSFINFQVP